MFKFKTRFCENLSNLRFFLENVLNQSFDFKNSFSTFTTWNQCKNTDKKTKYLTNTSADTINFEGANSLRSCRVAEVGPVLSWSQFHQQFTCEYFIKSFFLVAFWLWTNFRTKNARVKCWWNWHLESISSTFYPRVFRMQANWAAFL